jgi:hypothetical protein
MNLVLVINDDRKEFNVIAEKMSAMGEDLCRMTKTKFIRLTFQFGY